MPAKQQCEEMAAMLLRYAGMVRAHRDRFDFMEGRSPFYGKTHELLTEESTRAEQLAGLVLTMKGQ